MLNIFTSILAFNEHQLLKKIDSIPKILDKDIVILNSLLLNEELNEYLQACQNNDLVEIADALGDMFYVLWGIICKHGMQEIFHDKIIVPICESNNTKFCNTRKEAIQSVKKYAKKNIQTTYCEWNGKYVIFNLETGKLLKGINYQEPMIEL